MKLLHAKAGNWICRCGSRAEAAAVMKEIDTILSKILLENKSPSVQYIFFDKQQILKRYQAGLADIRRKEMVDGNTTYNAFSVTKTFTALAVLQLAAAKKLEIDQPVKSYLQDFPYSPGITIRQLLSHSAGIPNPIPLSWIHLTNEHSSFDRNKFFSAVFARNNKTRSAPNEKFAYSNLGYVLLGELIEKVSGLTYEQYITDNIIDKLGLTSDQLAFEIPGAGSHAKGYQKRISWMNLLLDFFIEKRKYMLEAEGYWKPFKNYYVNGASYGGLIGTPDAFVRYIQALLQPGSLLIPDDFKKLLFTETYTRNNKATGMCLSWFTGELKGRKYFAHAGGGGGYYCEIRVYPESGMGSVIFLNRTGMGDERLLDKVDWGMW